jgi:hypothetical protein
LLSIKNISGKLITSVSFGIDSIEEHYILVKHFLFSELEQDGEPVFSRSKREDED